MLLSKAIYNEQTVLSGWKTFLMKLAFTLPEGQNYKIYADSYFPCVPLLEKLLDRGIHHVGTSFAGPEPVQKIQDWDKAI